MRTQKAVFSILVVFFGGWSYAQEPLTYQTPPKAIADLVNAPLTPNTMLSPSKEQFVYMERPAMSGIDELSQPELRIAGLRINPRTNGRSRSSHYIGLSIRPLMGGKEVKITRLPTNPKISSVSWSPNGKQLAFAVTSNENISLWIADTKRGKAKLAMKNSLNATYGTPVSYTHLTLPTIYSV